MKIIAVAATLALIACGKHFADDNGKLAGFSFDRVEFKTKTTPCTLEKVPDVIRLRLTRVVDQIVY